MPRPAWLIIIRIFTYITIMLSGVWHRCHLPIMHIGQDEKIWKAYQMQAATYKVCTVIKV